MLRPGINLSANAIRKKNDQLSQYYLHNISWNMPFEVFYLFLSFWCFIS
jgi:hypothetical protein